MTHYAKGKLKNLTNVDLDFNNFSILKVLFNHSFTVLYSIDHLIHFCIRGGTLLFKQRSFAHFAITKIREESNLTKIFCIKFYYNILVLRSFATTSNYSFDFKRTTKMYQFVLKSLAFFIWNH